MQYSAGHSQSTRQRQIDQQINSPEPGSTVRASQRGPVRTIYPQQTDHENMSNFYKNSPHTHIVCLDNERSLEQVLSVPWLSFIKREISCPGTCAVPVLCHPTCVGEHDFSH